MREISELNINEGGNPVIRPAPSQDTVIAYQREFGLSIPADYICFLNEANGGHPEKNSFVPLGNDEDNRWEICRFYNLSDTYEDVENIWHATQEWRKHLGNFSIPIGYDGGGNQIFLDTRDDVKVCLCIHDEGFKVIDIAPSFTAFLDILEEDPEMI